MIDKLEYTDDHELVFLDQTLLPLKEKYVRTRNYKDVAEAIAGLKIRGAPLIGIAAAYGAVLGAHYFKSSNMKNFEIHFYKVVESLRNTRPTARNLFYALDRMCSVFENNKDKEMEDIPEILMDEADRIYDEDIEMCNRIAVNGADLIGDRMSILTHCNTGELAAGGSGTALGIIFKAKQLAKDVYVYVDETRPLLQGARLTTYELEKNGIKYELIVDSLAATLMKEGLIDCVLIGADRITSNGDVINKVGSYSLAVNCAHHKIPFYVAAPGSTIDFDTESGADVEIEERDPDEVRTVGESRITGYNIPVMNPAFDMVPSDLVSAVITEHRVHYSPYDFKSIKHLFRSYVETVSGERNK